MEKEHKNQDRQEKYFSGIFHALHRLVTKSGENRNKRYLAKKQHYRWNQGSGIDTIASINGEIDGFQVALLTQFFPAYI